MFRFVILIFFCPHIVFAQNPLEQLQQQLQTTQPSLYQPTQIGATLRFKDWVTSSTWIPGNQNSPDPQAVLGTFDEVRFYDQDSKLIKSLSLDFGPVKSLQYVPTNGRLYAGCHQAIVIIDAIEKTIIGRLKGHRGEVNSLAYDEPRHQLLSVSNDQSIRFWNLQTNEQTAVIEKVGLPIYGIDVSSPQNLFAIGLGDEAVLSAEGLVQLWSLESHKKIADLADHKKQTTSVCFTPDGSKLLSTSLDERVNVYDVKTHQPIGFFGGHSRPTNDVVVLQDNDTIISASGGIYKKKYEVKFWKLSDPEEFGSFEPHSDAVLSIALSPDEKRLLTTSQEKTAALWDLSQFPAPAEPE